MEFAPYNKKAFLLPDSINSAAMYHAKIFPDGRYIFRIHDCLTGIRLTGDLNEEQDFKDAFDKATELAFALFEFAVYVENRRKEYFSKVEICNTTDESDMPYCDAQGHCGDQTISGRCTKAPGYCNRQT